MFRYQPSIYYVINEMKATDYCGNLIGPVLTSVVVSYDLDQVSTLPPFANSNEWQTRMGPPTQLYLSDLRTDCPLTYSEPPDNHNVYGDPNYDPGCNPVIEYKTELKDSVAGLVSHELVCIVANAVPVGPGRIAEGTMVES